MTRRFLRTISKNILLITAFFILFAIGFHAVESHHEHSEIFGSSEVQAYLHGGDKKLWLLAALGLMGILGAGFIPHAASHHFFLGKYAIRHASHLLNDLSKLFDPLRRALRAGILNPKLYG